MKLCDITMAYNESSGGIRTYIDEKRRYLLTQTEHEHLLVVPGAEDKIAVEGRATTVYIESPLLPGQDNYRFFLWPGKIKQVLLEHRPDIIELGSYYVEPWVAFAYRKEMQLVGRNCLISCYFHTDVAEAYVGAPLRAIAHDWFDEWILPLATISEKFANIAEMSMESYIGGVFALCDLAMAASPAQIARLHEYGVPHVELVPLGVDVQVFHPSRRSEDVRIRYGARADNLVLVYAGRLCFEKRVLTLVEALQLMPPQSKAVLWLVGHGPLFDEMKAMADRIGSLHILPFENDRVRFARILASADIYVTAGPHETFALSVIEAQASGLPIVGVDAGALRDRVPKELGYLGPIGDPRAMAENIMKASTERSELGERARRHVEQNFSWDSTFQRLLTCYAEGLAKLVAP